MRCVSMSMTDYTSSWQQEYAQWPAHLALDAAKWAPYNRYPSQLLSSTFAEGCRLCMGETHGTQSRPSPVFAR